MAGGWGHVVNEAGVYEDARMLENGGDVEEFAQHVYGMVWYLASMLALRSGITAEEWIADAERNYSMGLASSPSDLFKERP